MPEDYRVILEPNTSSIFDRLNSVYKFIDAGYNVHLNFSPVIVEPGWLDKYKELFVLISTMAYMFNWANDSVKAEVIFLTHNKNKHQYNIDKGLLGEELLWKPEIQESKISQYGGDNIRYKYQLKAQYIEQFKQLHNSIIPWNTIRYIF